MANVLQEKKVLLSWAFLVLLLLVTVFFIILPTVSYSSSLGEKIAADYKRLARYQQVTEATPEYNAEYERVKKQGLDKLFYPEGMTDAQVAKELQKQLSMIVSRNKGTLIRSEVLDSLDREKEAHAVYQQVAVRASLQGDSRLLRSLLHQSYQARPLIFVEKLAIKPKDKQRRLNNKNQTKQAQIIKAEVVISTYWRGGEINNENAD
ncbi:MAG TPA: general secretion pathway protein GspM [Thiothrix sp.]|nr:general secretion pathway protein GspM [Thiothrix sp.]